MKNHLSNDLCILILNYNLHDDVIGLVHHLKDEGMDYRIIIVDNCSTDGSFELLKKELQHEEKVDVIKSDRNGGYGYGNNYGAKYIMANYKPKYILISNPDVIFTKTNVSNMVLKLEDDEKNAVSALKMIDQDGMEHISAWKLPNIFDDMLVSLTILHRLLGNPMIRKIKKNGIQFVDVVQGALFLIKSQYFQEVGFYDEKTFLYGEERILAHKLKEQGLKVVYNADDYFVHNVGSSISKSYSSRLKKYLLLQNSRKVYYKYYRKSKFELMLFQLIFLLGYLEKFIIDQLALLIHKFRKEN